MNIWQAIVKSIKAEGIKHVFGLPGGDLFYDALYDHPDISPVLVREESSGAFMAIAYARMTGKPGICYASSGPGVANIVTGDGAFQMFMKELPTAVQHNAPVTYVVLNNGCLGWIKFGQKQRNNRFIASDFHVQPDFVEIAIANKCYGE